MSEPFIRRFPRVRLEKSLGEVFRELEAQLVWPNHEISQVIDLSYKGCATLHPALFTVTLAERVPLEVVLGRDHHFPVSGKVVWTNDHAVGFEFETLSAESHRGIGQYMDANVLGASLRAVNREFFSPEESFDYWYQGATGTHVLIWLKPDRLKIERVRIDLNGRIVEFQSGRQPQAPGPLEQQALLLLSQIDKSKLPMEEFIRSLGS